MPKKADTTTESQSSQSQQKTESPFDQFGSFFQVSQDMMAEQMARLEQLRTEMEALTAKQMQQWQAMGEQAQHVTQATATYLKDLGELWRNATVSMSKQASEIFTRRAA